MSKIKIGVSIVLLCALALFGLWQKTQPAKPTNEVQSKKPVEIEIKEIENQIPQHAITTWQYIRKYHKAPSHFVGGREFKNRERKLPIRNEDGTKPIYREWDIYPKREGVNRGAERLVSLQFEKAWYTPDHYNTFIELTD
ncbi:MAG: hypothetical protein IPI46_06395 [Bacteroidetes bacterium]|nr:hypothetical protein [Bacteroidota bacterium]